MKHIQSEHIADFVRYWNMGYTYQQMATMLPYTASAIYQNSRVLKSQGKISYRSRQKRSIKAQLVKEAYLDGMTDVHDLAQRFHTTAGSISVYLVGLGIRAKQQEMKREILQKLEQGMSQSDVSKIYNVSRQYVHKVKKENY